MAVNLADLSASFDSAPAEVGVKKAISAFNQLEARMEKFIASEIAFQKKLQSALSVGIVAPDTQKFTSAITGLSGTTRTASASINGSFSQIQQGIRILETAFRGNFLSAGTQALRLLSGFRQPVEEIGRGVNLTAKSFDIFRGAVTGLGGSTKEANSLLRNFRESLNQAAAGDKVVAATFKPWA